MNFPVFLSFGVFELLLFDVLFPPVVSVVSSYDVDIESDFIDMLTNAFVIGSVYVLLYNESYDILYDSIVISDDARVLIYEISLSEFDVSYFIASCRFCT